MQTELLLVVIVKALAELAGMFLLGRGLLWVLAGGKRMDNIFYQVLAIVTDPISAPRAGSCRASCWTAISRRSRSGWCCGSGWRSCSGCCRRCARRAYDCSALLERKRGD